MNWYEGDLRSGSTKKTGMGEKLNLEFSFVSILCTHFGIETQRGEENVSSHKRENLNKMEIERKTIYSGLYIIYNGKGQKNIGENFFLNIFKTNDIHPIDDSKVSKYLQMKNFLIWNSRIGRNKTNWSKGMVQRLRQLGVFWRFASQIRVWIELHFCGFEDRFELRNLFGFRWAMCIFVALKSIDIHPKMTWAV